MRGRLARASRPITLRVSARTRTINPIPKNPGRLTLREIVRVAHSGRSSARAGNEVLPLTKNYKLLPRHFGNSTDPEHRRDRPLHSPICKPYFGTACFHLSQWATTSLMKGADAAHRLLMAGTKPPEPPSGPQPHRECQADSPG
jgi:hypothetical protein